jgi:hypothetical protein
VEKYGTARQATDDNIIRRMRFACWVTKATDTHSQYVILIFFHCNSGYANAPYCCVCTYMACVAQFCGSRRRESCKGVEGKVHPVTGHESPNGQ